MSCSIYRQKNIDINIKFKFKCWKSEWGDQISIIIMNHSDWSCLYAHCTYYFESRRANTDKIKNTFINLRLYTNTWYYYSAVAGKNLVNSILDETEKIKKNYRLLIMYLNFWTFIERWQFFSFQNEINAYVYIYGPRNI